MVTFALRKKNDIQLIDKNPFMKKLATVIALAAASIAFAQQQVLFTIGDEAISTEEFKAVYLKNRDIGRDIDPKTPSEYLDLYINFKLKVKQARELGYDTLPSFKREFNNYRKQLAQPYLEDRSMDSLLIAEAYERMKYEVRASHIMVDLRGDALPADTLAAWNKIMGIRSAIVNKGGDFGYNARKFSTDSYSAARDGDLGFFTVFGMVYPFETAAYNTPIGEVSMPVRSQYGYHLIKVTDKRQASGSVQVRHIFLISNDQTESEKVLAAEARINEIFVRLQNGEKFEQLAMQFSDDKNTSESGGLLQPFGINTMLPEFEKSAFALQKVGDFSAPFKTNIGWHIVKLVEKRPIPSFEDAKNDIEQKIRRDSRSGLGKEKFVQSLRTTYNLQENPKRLNEIYKVVDASILTGEWNIAKGAKLNKTLFSFNGVEVSQQAFLQHLDMKQKSGEKSPTAQQEVFKQYNDFLNNTLLNYEDARLEEKYPQFKMLITEYRDGILLFDLTQERVWGKASLDSVGLDAFYQANKEKYMWPERVLVEIYSCESQKVAGAVAKLAVKNTLPEDIESRFNKDSKLVVVRDGGKFARGDNKAVDAAMWKKNAVSTVELNNRFVVVKVLDLLAPQNKELTEARGLIISDYQKKLDENWLAELKQKYPVAINEIAFKELEKELK